MRLSSSMNRLHRDAVATPTEQTIGRRRPVLFVGRPPEPPPWPDKLEQLEQETAGRSVVGE